MSCFARANTGLTASYNTTIEVENILPNAEILNIDRNESSRIYTAYLSGDDIDGYIIRGELELITPLGASYIIEAIDAVQLDLEILGDYTLNYRVQDNDGGWSEVTSRIVSSTNLAPIALYDFYFESDAKSLTVNSGSYDLDGVIVSHDVVATHPSTGTVYSNSYTANTFSFYLENAGDWIIEIKAKDNDNGISESFIANVFSKNENPIANLLTSKINSNLYSLSGENSTDSDGQVVEYKFVVLSPSGASSDIITSDSSIQYEFLEDGDWNIKLFVTDDLGGVSENIASSTISVDTLPPDPGEEGKLTLEGVDADNDGIRDDVERIIASFSISEEKKAILKQYARDLQRSLLAFENIEESIQITRERIRYSYCLEASLTEYERDRFESELIIEQFNTKDRVINWAKVQENFGGQLVRIDTDIDNYIQYCDI